MVFKGQYLRMPLANNTEEERNVSQGAEYQLTLIKFLMGLTVYLPNFHNFLNLFFRWFTFFDYTLKLL
jgi:hypothetical protein